MALLITILIMSILVYRFEPTGIITVQIHLRVNLIRLDYSENQIRALLLLTHYYITKSILRQLLKIAWDLPLLGYSTLSYFRVNITASKLARLGLV
jgi:hypothetical protein